MSPPEPPPEINVQVSCAGPDSLISLDRRTKMCDMLREGIHYSGGDHSLFLGRVEYARQNEGTPLLVHGGCDEKLGQTG